MAETKTTKTTTSKKKSAFEGHPMVTIRLPMSRHEKDDEWVSVNGNPLQIKRGLDVQVPRCVSLLLEEKERLLMKVMENEEALSGKNSDNALN